MSTKGIISSTREALSAYSPALDQDFHRRYRGTDALILKLPIPKIREIAKSLVREFRNDSHANWFDALAYLYQSNIHDERLLAGYLIGANPDLLSFLSPVNFRDWMSRMTGWAEVDSSCQSLFSGKSMAEYWHVWECYLTAAPTDPSISVRRSSLVLLNRPVREKADQRFATQALANIDALKNEQEILITKAVSWLLRELIKNHRQEVEDYLLANQGSLPKIAIREAKAKLATGRKTIK